MIKGLEVLDKMFEIPSRTASAEQPEATQEPELIPAPVSLEHTGGRVHMLSVDLLNANERNPFKPYGEERFKALCESISKFGVMQPLLVRPVENRYEVFSGHNRWRAASAVGFAEIPAIIENLDDEEAAIRMVEINLQNRDDLLPSEKAWAYRIKMEAINRQGARTDLTSRQVVGRMDSADVIGQESDESGRQVQRYIRLTYLISGLLDMVDNKTLAFVAGVELSFLSEQGQQLVENYLIQEKKESIDIATAKELRELDATGELSKEAIDNLLTAPQAAPKAVSIKYKQIRQYFAPSVSEKEIIETLLKALQQYFTGVTHDGQQQN